MDVFFEQIVRIRRSVGDYFKILGIWVGVLVLSAILFYLQALTGGLLMMIALVLVALLFWGGVKLTALTYVEYEYIFTNRDFDIDKIVAKSSRKRVLSFKVPNVQKYGKYNPEAVPSGSVQKVYYVCDKDDENAMYMIVSVAKIGTVMVIFSPDERLRGALEENLPRIAF